MRKVIFRLESDVVSCGVNTESNFLNSEEYISGAVLRAGFAKDIYLSCDIDKRDNFINLKDPNGMCMRCEKRNICGNFSNMKFSFLYPQNCIPAPFTAKICKLHPKEHPIKDIMLENGNIICNKCREINKDTGRMEDAKGYIDISSVKAVKINKNTITHTSIDYATRTASDGNLYTTRAIPRGLMFEGYIDDCDTGLVKKGTTVYVGKYSSNGFGKLVVEKIYEAEPEKDIKKLIISYTEKYKANKSEDETDGKLYVPLLFLSDAKLGFESGIGIKTTDEYKQIWNEKLFGRNNIFEIKNVYSQNKFYSGYDTKAEWGKWQTKPQIITMKGTSILVAFNENDFEAAAEILENMRSKGVGEDTGNGYGDIDVCNKIHMLGV